MSVNQAGEVCGDVALSVAERRAYIKAGLADIFSAWRRRKPSVPIRRITLGNLTDLHIRAADAPSPLRLYTEACLEDILPTHCPKPATIMDLGCGPGGHANWFEKNGISGRYVGVDVSQHPKWSDRTPNGQISKELALGPCEELDLPQVRPNFTMSSNALEHFENDKTALRRVAAHAESGSFGLHIVPSTSSFLLYGYHGWRRYSPQSLTSALKESGFDVVEVIRLGGLPSYLLHFFWISVLESTMIQLMIVDLFPNNRITSKLRNFIRSMRVGKARTGPRMKRIYARLLSWSLRADYFFPFPAHGVAAVVRKP